MTESDLRSTLSLPRTDFPMKANLPQAEPRRLERWKKDDLYGRIRAARKGRPSFVLHDGPPYANGHIHLGHVLNKILKDVVLRSRSMFGKDAPYRPGWDCHGLPIELKVDRTSGRRSARCRPSPSAAPVAPTPRSTWGSSARSSSGWASSASGTTPT